MNNLFTCDGYGFNFVHGKEGGIRFTLCTVVMLLTEEILVVTRQNCHSTDQFSRSVGRKRSLTKALNAKLFSDAYGTELHAFKVKVWLKYFMRNPQNPNFK